MTRASSPKLAVAIGTWFGCGYAPLAPGTAGSLGALVIGYPLVVAAHWRPFYFALLALAVLPVGVWSATETARQVGAKDPGIVVVDEVLGQWITLAGATVFNWKSWLAAFCLFRLFDIWKPWPVRRFEALPEGTGIVADDVMAGVYGALVLFLMGCFNLY
jgi:phosphatidylglycerophosphatase A